MYSTCCRSNVFNSSVAASLPISIKWAGKEFHIHFLEVCLILTEPSTISRLWLCHCNPCTAWLASTSMGKGKLNRQNSTKAPWIQGIWTEGSPLWGFSLSNKQFGDAGLPQYIKGFQKWPLKEGEVLQTHISPAAFRAVTALCRSAEKRRAQSCCLLKGEQETQWEIKMSLPECIKPKPSICVY